VNVLKDLYMLGHLSPAQPSKRRKRLVHPSVPRGLRRRPGPKRRHHISRLRPHPARRRTRALGRSNPPTVHLTGSTRLRGATRLLGITRLLGVTRLLGAI